MIAAEEFRFPLPREMVRESRRRSDTIAAHPEGRAVNKRSGHELQDGILSSWTHKPKDIRSSMQNIVLHTTVFCSLEGPVEEKVMQLERTALELYLNHQRTR